MAQASAFTVNDGAAVAHTFTPAAVSNGSAEYRNFAASYHIGQEVMRLTASHSGALRKVTMTLQVPRLIVETVNGLSVPSVPDYVTMKVECMVPKTWDATAVHNLTTLFSNIMANASFDNAFKSGEFVY